MMGGKYEVRYYIEHGSKDDSYYGEGINYETIYTNNWLEFIKARLFNKVIYYKVYCD